VKIQFSTRAQRDLKAIWQFVHADNPPAADKVLNAIDLRLQQLLDHPFSGQPRYDLGPAIRHLIVRVFHGSRRLPSRL
jgi:toxin ParE1/3/4